MSSRIILVFRSLMIPAKYQAASSALSEQEDAIHDKDLLSRWGNRFAIAAGRLKNRLGDRLKTHQLILLSVNVDSLEEAEELRMNSAPSNDFVENFLVEARPDFEL